MPDTVRSAFGFCVQQVRQYDYPNYVWVAQMDKELRPALFALRAFNIETALVADQVRSRESVVGQIRFQWWRDAVRAAYEDRPPNHPVAIALAHVLHSPGPAPPAVAAPASSAAAATAGGAQADAGCSDSGCGSDSPRSSSAAAAASSSSSSPTGPGRFSRYSFKRIIDVRESDFLDPQPPLDMGALESYAEGTASQLLYLQLAAAGIKHRDADHAASHLGRAIGITTLLRGTAAHAAARRSYLPVDLCAEARVSQEDVYSGVVSEGLRDVAHKVASLAKGHLDEARRLAPRLPPGAAGLMLPAVAVERYLQALEAVNFDPFDAGLLKQHGGGSGAAPLSYVLAIKWHQMRGTY
ncbi:hypothetical protein HXX76_002430 [Chlamydomonas incerta]|uniref:Phytoene synthase n=1 Tax=Chlamydomonas incerta TaxID=51695 RepID=A0A835TBG2_CHLIN|nr:hypothetical protein HXX76_002430 [Chlamydomonas incerta]|eukprot:KAG2442344.1 hypothetical protein HXX76_002430 [Chlamydomonas incerta]